MLRGDMVAADVTRSECVDSSTEKVLDSVLLPVEVNDLSRFRLATLSIKVGGRAARDRDDSPAEIRDGLQLRRVFFSDDKRAPDCVVGRAPGQARGAASICRRNTSRGDIHLLSQRTLPNPIEFKEPHVHHQTILARKGPEKMDILP